MKSKDKIAYTFRNAIEGGVPYIHYKYESFKMNNTQYSGIDYNALTGTNYRSARTLAKKRTISMYNKMGVANKKNREKLINTLYSIFAMSERPNVVENIIGKEMKDKAAEMIAKIKRDINPVALKGGVRHVIVKDENINWLNSLMNTINSLDSNLKKVDTSILEAFSDDEKPKDLIINNELRLVHYDKTATTSLKNLVSQVEEINKISEKTDTGAIAFSKAPKTMNYKDKEIDFTKVLGAIGQQTLNIQGAILEGVTYAAVQKAINENILQPYAKDGQKFEVTKMGGSANKSDVALTLMEDGPDGYKSVLSIGISSKSTAANPGSKTVFQTSSWESVFKKSRALNTIEEYKLLNYYSHDKGRMGEALALRKYIASKDIAKVIMGELDDSVYFVQTLTSLTTVESLFDEFISSKNYTSLVPERGGAAFSPAQDANKIFGKTEYARSKIVLDLVRKVNLQYTFTHS